MTAQALIQTEMVNKIYNQQRPDAFQAVRDVSLQINQASVVALKGPSGSGKTSLLSLLGAMARPTSGRVFVSDREISRLPERFLTEVRRNTFGFIFQQFQLIRNLTVLENILLPCYPLGLDMREIRARGMTLAEQFGLVDKVSNRIDQLSGGEQQRVAISRALINDPLVLIADEPTAHLDSRLAGEFLSSLEQLNEQGRTIVIATHDPYVFNHSFVQQVVTMHDGQVTRVEDQ
jgi:putative ABC transport system ATP-binding protein